MPYRELTEIDVKEMLRRWSAGQGDRRIGRDTGVDRKIGCTVHGCGWSVSASFAATEVTDEEVHCVAQYVQSRPEMAPPSEQWNDVAQPRERIARWIAGDSETQAASLD